MTARRSSLDARDACYSLDLDAPRVGAGGRLFALYPGLPCTADYIL